MQIAFRLLIILLAVTPALALAHGLFVAHVVAATATGILMLAAAGPPTDLATTAQLLKRFSPAIAFPALWMAFQLAPLPFPSICNPIWATASAALGESAGGCISIDSGATLRSLILYLAMVALLIATIIVARDRHRAETMFYALNTVTTFVAAETLIARFDVLSSLVPPAGSPAAAAFASMAALSVVANAASIFMAIDRYLSRRSAEIGSLSSLLIQIALVLFGLAISLAALWALHASGILASVALGLLAIVTIAFARRLDMRSSPATIMFVIIAAIAVAIAIPRLHTGDSPTIAAFASPATPESLSVAQRALADTPQLGNGVGTFRSLQGIYRDFGAAPAVELPSSALSIAIEWGPPAMAILILLALLSFVLMFRGAIRRGRDSHFASTAAAGVLVLLCETFFDQSLLSPTVQLVAAVMLGLGIAQSAGRTKGLD